MHFDSKHNFYNMCGLKSIIVIEMHFVNHITFDKVTNSNN